MPVRLLVVAGGSGDYKSQVLAVYPLPERGQDSLSAASQVAYPFSLTLGNILCCSLSGMHHWIWSGRAEVPKESWLSSMSE
jgi:hypothetical protein